MRIFHLALASHWADAVASGSYTTSTLGRTLAEEGFIHCSHESQVAGVRRAFYADVEEPVVVLTVDTARLTSPWQLDEVPGAAEPFPHVYGPLDLDAVVAVTPLLPEPAVPATPAPSPEVSRRPAR
ncbi:MAG: DUF952 domain-containing protein [Nocardioidaceae bacterium]